uniref:Uncharacterized protein n=1 Tax=uncultured marine virus TaxID=186617 RepID=A0A0F7L814_9VIRU|nr:hypothetical protein BDAG_00942 [uncultured marine virus]
MMHLPVVGFRSHTWVHCLGPRSSRRSQAPCDGLRVLPLSLRSTPLLWIWSIWTKCRSSCITIRSNQSSSCERIKWYLSFVRQELNSNRKKMAWHRLKLALVSPVISPLRVHRQGHRQQHNG